MNKNEFEKDLEIDIENLEVEATLQPELYFKYAEVAAQAKKKAALAKLNLDVIEAELAQRARLKPRTFNIKNITNPSIKEAVQLQADYKLARRKMIQAQHLADVLSKAENSFEHRKRSLEMLIKLEAREYFAGPSIPHTPGSLKKLIKEKKGKETHEKMIKKAQKRKRVKE